MVGAGSSLRDQVMRKLRITWSDEATNARVQDDMDNARAVLIDKIGIPDPDYDFSKPGQENLLYVNYCYYAWNDAEDDFLSNYFDDIMQARRKWEVIQYAEEKEGAAKL